MKERKKHFELPKIQPVGLVDTPKSWVIYGRPGTGKTTLACSWPKPLLLLDFNDRGTDSVSKIKGVDVAHMRNPEHVDAVYWMLERKNKYNTVVFDTVTQYQAMVLEDITGERNNARWGALTRAQYGTASGKLKVKFEEFRDLDMETVFLAQERVFNISEEEEVGSDDLQPTVGSRLMPSVADALHSAVNVVSQTYIRHRTKDTKIGHKIKRRAIYEYCLYVGPHPGKTTKIRKNKTEDSLSFLVNATYENLMEYIEGEDNGKK